MGNIITFYSYKGGVGRSMALANIAYLLATKNKKILIVDWDLEAPGLERYFDTDDFTIRKSKNGLLQYLDALKKGKSTEKDYLDYCWEIDLAHSNSTIFLMTSGRDSDTASYSKLLEEFDWNVFFTESKGGYHLDSLRNIWKKDFDHVLIDSRTGLSDSSGICTIFMPDILVPMFTANYQSLFGIKDTVEFINNARQKLEVDRMALTILPIPSRFGTRVEFQQSQEWLDRIDDILSHFVNDWLPKWVETRHVFEQIKIPQMDYFSFGEKLAVYEQGISDSEGMGFVYSKITDLISSDFQEIANFVGQEYFTSRKKEFENNKDSASNQKTDINYDVYLSYSRTDYEWVNEAFLPTFRDYLGEELGYAPKIYVDVNKLGFFQGWSENMRSGIDNSKCFVFVLGTKLSEFQTEEFKNFEKYKLKSESNSANIFPVLLHDKNDEQLLWQTINMPSDLMKLQTVTFNKSRSLNSKNTRDIVDFGKKVEKLSKRIANVLNQSELVDTLNNPEIRLSNVENRLNELRLMASEYELLRVNMISGYDRTQKMEHIVSRMKSISHNAANMIEQLQDSESAGERLAAIAIMQVNPDLRYSDWLKKHVGDAEKSFVGYQACVALFIITRRYSSKFPEQLYSDLTEAKLNVETSKKKDAGQLRVLVASLNLGRNQDRNLPLD